MNNQWMKHFIMALTGALVAIPSIVGGFYLTYQLVTYLGN
jgi:ABC-type phosphate transport system permease subunit